MTADTYARLDAAYLLGALDAHERLATRRTWLPAGAAGRAWPISP
jgi:hypothetical protein